MSNLLLIWEADPRFSDSMKCIIFEHERSFGVVTEPIKPATISLNMCGTNVIAELLLCVQDFQEGGGVATSSGAIADQIKTVLF